MEMSRWVKGFLVVAVLLLVGACASDQKAKPNIANAEMGIQRAREANAINHAPLELRLAEEKLEQARGASRDEKYEEARRLADQSLADARVAEMKSQAAQTTQTEQQIRQGVSDLRREALPPPPATTMGR